MRPALIACLLACAAPAMAAPSILAVSQSAYDGVVHNYVERFDGAGALKSRIDLGTKFEAAGVALVDSTIYVSSFSSAEIRCYDLGSGAFWSTLVSNVPGYGGLSADATGLWAGDGVPPSRQRPV